MSYQGKEVEVFWNWARAGVGSVDMDVMLEST
jgi:hypothetical protein